MTAPPPDEASVLALAAVVHRLEQARRIAEQRARLRMADLRLMWLFGDRVPRTQREIADALGLEQSTINRQVGAAVAAGLLRREEGSGGPNRAGLVTVTDEGLASFEEDQGMLLDFFTRGLERLSPPERAVLIDALGRFVAGYGDAVREPAG